MTDTAFGEFIEDCRRVRGSLIGLIEAIESKMLGPGQPITVPESLAEPTEAVLATMDRMVADFDLLIEAFEKGEHT